MEAGKQQGVAGKEERRGAAEGCVEPLGWVKVSAGGGEGSGLPGSPSEGWAEPLTPSRYSSRGWAVGLSQPQRSQGDKTAAGTPGAAKGDAGWGARPRAGSAGGSLGISSRCWLRDSAPLLATAAAGDADGGA